MAKSSSRSKKKAAAKKKVAAVVKKLSMLPDLLLSQKKYPEHVFRTLFQRPTDLLQHWDELNRKRHITGIAGNDAHQNVGVRGRTFTAPSLLRLARPKATVAI